MWLFIVVVIELVVTMTEREKEKVCVSLCNRLLEVVARASVYPLSYNEQFGVSGLPWVFPL